MKRDVNRFSRKTWWIRGLKYAKLCAVARRGGEVVTRGSAKPLCEGPIPFRASERRFGNGKDGEHPFPSAPHMSKETGSHAENQDIVSNFFHALLVEVPTAAIAFVNSLAGFQSARQLQH